MRVPLPRRSLAGQLVLIVCCVMLCSSCVTEKEFLYLNDQIVALNKRVDTMDSRVSKEVDAKLLSVREQQAKADVELTKIREDMQSLSGRLDENNRLVLRAIERDTTTQDDMGSSMADLKDRVSRLELEVKRLNAYLSLEPMTATGGSEIQEGAVVAPGQTIQVPVVKKPVPVVKEPEVPAEERLYEVSLALYREEKYEEAIAGFKNFLEKYPKSKLADNAQFWVAECHMALKQYEQAILGFQRVIKKYPKGNKVPNAILRQALAFYEINDKTSARLLLKKLIKQYPRSTEAKIAKGKLKAMK